MKTIINRIRILLHRKSFNIILRSFILILLLQLIAVHIGMCQNDLQTIRKSAVHIRVTRQTGNFEGAGFFVSEQGDVVTTRHVLINAVSAEIQTSNGKVFPIEAITGEDVDGDLVRVSTKATSDCSIPANYETEIPKPGSPILILGSEFIPARGSVTSVDTLPFFGPRLRYQANTMQGFSGGPIANSSGRLLGVVAAFTDSDGENRISYALTVQRIIAIPSITPISVASYGKSRKSTDYASVTEVLYTKGFELLKKREYRTADSCFVVCAKSSTLAGNAQLYSLLGHTKTEIGEFEEAKYYLRLAITQSPKEALYYFQLSETHTKEGNAAAAIDTLRIAVELEPVKADYRESLAKALFRSGNRQEACKQLTILKEMGAKNTKTLELQIGPCK